MSGLTAIGAVVGGGAVAGVVVVSAGVVVVTGAGVYGGYHLARWLTTKG
jgi:hypothetical protein